MRLMLGCLLAVAACGGDGDMDGPNFVDAPSSQDAAASSDAAPQQGLEVTWIAQPAIPGPFASGVAVTTLKLDIARLEVLGDTGTTVNTTQTDFLAIWSAGTSPFPLSFAFAPSGLYSQVSIEIDGDVAAPSYEITGMFMNGGQPEPFVITDTAALSVDITGYTINLTPGSPREVPIRVDLQDALDAVNFAMLPLVNNARRMDQNTTGIAAVRTAMQSTVFLRGN